MFSRFSRPNANGDVEVSLGCRSTVFVNRLYDDECTDRHVLVGLRSKTSLGFTQKARRVRPILVNAVHRNHMSGTRLPADAELVRDYLPLFAGQPKIYNEPWMGPRLDLTPFCGCRTVSSGEGGSSSPDRLEIARHGRRTRVSSTACGLDAAGAGWWWARLAGDRHLGTHALSYALPL
jgi:hypothetical protein